MSRRPVVALALLTVAAVGLTPAHAATKKPKTIKGSYALSLQPDPTQDVTGQATDPVGCAKVLPGSWDEHPFKVPGAGKLTVTLNGPATPATPVGPDWDLWVFDSSGELVDASHGETSHEETTDKFKKATGLVFEVCNLTGDTAGTVTYTFTYA